LQQQLPILAPILNQANSLNCASFHLGSHIMI
jgi:hypothetical protein